MTARSIRQDTLAESTYIDSQYGDNFDTLEKCDFCKVIKLCMEAEDETIGACYCCADCHGK